ncbi:MAG: type II toxin-antitoxin system PemK/MazF family toxin [Bryobacteraceae bacterium]|nr:type II toxin-antitoxin system PemK/MazF family toxin [Bryobacteraceae bacterium]
MKFGWRISAWPQRLGRVIVSRHDPEAPRALVLYIPLTTQNRSSRYEVPLPRFPFLHQDSIANVQGLASIPTSYLERRLGRVSEPTMTDLKRALAFALDME